MPIVIRGPSGVGKSELLRALCNRLNLSGPYVALLHVVESPAHNLDHVVDDLARQLISAELLPTLNIKDLATSIVHVAKDSSWTIATTLLLGSAARFVPGIQNLATKLTDRISTELANTLPAPMIERLRANVPQDLLVGFLNVLMAIDEVGVAGAILIDQAEAASDVVREALLGLALQMPRHWSMILAVNDEIPEGIEFLAKVWPRLAYAAADQFVLNPLGVDALDIWCLAERGSAPNALELESVVSNCQGRPLLLREWVAGASSDAEISNIWQRLGPYYQRRINSLSAAARSTIRTIALLPARSIVPLSLITNLPQFDSATQAFHVVEELTEAQFLEPVLLGEDSYRFVHDITRQQVLRAIPRTVVKEAAINLLRALRSSDTILATEQDLYTIAKLQFQAENYGEFLTAALPAADRLFATGSFTPALELYRTCMSLDADCLSESAEVEARLGMAAVLHATGYYGEGLQLLTDADSWPGLNGARALLAKGRLLLRLSQFHEARSLLARSRSRYAELANIEGVIQCDKEDITILRDLGYYAEAVEKARDLLARGIHYNVQNSILASCYRSLARSLAFTGPVNEALEVADLALSLAQQITSPSAVGNARLAVAEVYRLSARPFDALEHYKAASETGMVLGDRDAYLWSLLGLADCYLLMRRPAEARHVLTPVKSIVAGNRDRYPLVHLHWRLSEVVVDFLQGSNVIDDLAATVAEYERLGVRWVENYAADLLATRKPTAKLLG